jgi:hypothetical protein
MFPYRQELIVDVGTPFETPIDLLGKVKMVTRRGRKMCPGLILPSDRAFLDRLQVGAKSCNPLNWQ